jgi:uncharacterized membrane protein YqjE
MFQERLMAMPPTAISGSDARAASPKHFATQLPVVVQDRAELLMVEVPKERGRRLRAIRLALGVAVFGFLSRAALTVALVVIFWSLSLMALAARRLNFLRRGGLPLMGLGPRINSRTHEG